MDIMDRSAMREPPAPSDWDPARDQVVVLRGISWDQYDGLLCARGQPPIPRMAYLDGELELVTVSESHESRKKLVARLLEAFAEETGVALNGFGNATYRRKARKAGLEPDECYRIGRGRRNVPDLAIEIVHTSGNLNKLEIYRRLTIGEVWFWIDERFWVYSLIGGEYEPQPRSTVLPKIELGAIAKIVRSTSDHAQTEAVRNYRKTLRRRR